MMTESRWMLRSLSTARPEHRCVQSMATNLPPGSSAQEPTRRSAPRNLWLTCPGSRAVVTLLVNHANRPVARATFVGALLIGLLIGLVWPPARTAVAAGVLLQINAVLTDAFPDVAVYLTVVDDHGLPIVPDQSRMQVTHNGRAVTSFSLNQVDNSQEG